MKVTINPDNTADLESDDGTRFGRIPNYDPRTMQAWSSVDALTAYANSFPEKYLVAPHVPTTADFDSALTSHLDATAQSRRYDNRITCMVRAGFAGPFQGEAIAFAQWADACNAKAYQLMSEVQAGTRPMPTSTKALIDLMPEMVWPI